MIPEQHPAPPLTVNRERILAFRLQRQHLVHRLPPGALAEAAACALQDNPPGAVDLALAARVEGVSPAQVEAALGSKKTLLRLWSLRGASYVVPTREAAVFTAGVLPDDEAGRRFFVKGATPLLDRLGLTLEELNARTREAVLDLLDPAPFAGKNELAMQVAAQMEPRLPAALRAVWQAPQDMGPTGFVLVSFALRFVALEGLLCFGGRKGAKPLFWRMDRWLGAPLPTMEPQEARAELLRRYLRYYGPATRETFAAWAGIDPAQARRAWGLVAPELVAVSTAAQTAYLLKVDAEALMAVVPPAGVRFLPPHDPYLDPRERDLLVPDRSWHARLWRTTVNPGLVLVDGELRALWQARKKGDRLEGVIEPFGPLSERDRRAIARGAELITPFKGANSATWAMVGSENL